MATSNKIQLLEKGDSGRTMMHADVANEVIAALNRLLSLQIKPEGAGRVIISDANIVIELKIGKSRRKNVCHNGQPATQGFYTDGDPQPL